MNGGNGQSDHLTGDEGERERGEEEEGDSDSSEDERRGKRGKRRWGSSFQGRRRGGGKKERERVATSGRRMEVHAEVREGGGRDGRGEREMTMHLVGQAISLLLHSVSLVERVIVGLQCHPSLGQFAGVTTSCTSQCAYSFHHHTALRA